MASDVHGFDDSSLWAVVTAFFAFFCTNKFDDECFSQVRNHDDVMCFHWELGIVDAKGWRGTRECLDSWQNRAAKVLPGLWQVPRRGQLPDHN